MQEASHRLSVFMRRIPAILRENTPAAIKLAWTPDRIDLDQAARTEMLSK